MTRLKNIKKILAVRDDRFGEFLLIIPALRSLKETYPEAELTLAVSQNVRELAECIEYADKVVIWDGDFRKNLRKQGFSACIIFNPKKETHISAFLAGIPVRCGYDRKWGFLLNYKIPDNKNLGLKHEVEYNLELAGLIATEAGDRSLSLARLPGYNNPAYTGAVAIHPYTSDKVKAWPPERFRELARQLNREPGVKVLIVGLSGQGREEFDDLGSGIINLVNRTSLVELAQILKSCRLLVSCDSGPVHLAAAVGTQVLALFRNDLAGKTPKRWGPWGEKQAVIEKSSLMEITVDEVADKVRDILR